VILLHRLNGSEFHLNAELIEQIESTPDTVITLITGNNIIVKEPADVVIEKIIDYRAQVARKAQARLDLTARRAAEAGRKGN